MRWRKIFWLWAKERGISTSAEYLPASENVLADKASRIFEWELDRQVFLEIVSRFGPLEIDKFASCLNFNFNLCFVKTRSSGSIH